MKKAFILFSTLIISIFFIWKISQSSDEFLFDLTDNVIIEQGPRTLKKDLVNHLLEQYASDHHALVVKRIITPTARGQNYVYQKFGKGELTKGLKEASNYEQSTSSEMSQYRVISGSLTNRQLGNFFKNKGYKVTIWNKRPVLFAAGSFLSSGSLVLSLFIFILTFIALTIILRIKDLRAAGIRLISGESIWSVMANSVKSDLLVISLAFLLSNGIGLIVFFLKGFLQLPYWKLLIVATFLYDGLLLLISVLLSLVYFWGLKKSDLLDIIKGKLPLRRLIGIMLFCQLLAVIIVGIGISQVPVYYSEMLEERKAANEWSKLDHRVNLMTGLATDVGDKNESANWYGLQNEAINDYDAIFVKNNFTNFPNGMKDPSGLTLESYDPQGNTLYVTPNYLKYENIKLDAKTKAKMNNLKLGEYGLIMPQKLRSDVKKYQELYEKYFKLLTAKEVKPMAITTYVSSPKERFAYNNIAVRPQQFIKDPIIMVLTPRSTGNNLNSQRFWKGTGVYYTFYRGYSQTDKLIKKHHLYEKIAAITDSQQSYEEQVQFFRSQTITFLASSILGIITSVILFNSMNILYFEEFRRSIFIKRISGMKFFELHYNYLVTQLVMIIIGAGINIFITKNFVTSLETLLIFGLSLMITLAYQIKKESRLAVTVLKGM